MGLEQAVPTASDSVKLLTIHRAKGLEWEDVYLPALADKVFPSDRVQGNWLSASAVLPADLRGDAANVPQLTDVSDAASKGYAQALKDEARRADDRLAYVAVTRARQHLVATTHAWSDLKNPRQHSPYLRVLERFAAEATHAEVSAENPLLGEGRGFPWPAPMDAAARARRAEAAASVERARAGDRPDPDGLLLDEAAVVATWDAAADQLLAEARLRRADAGVALPPYLSATALIALEDDAEGYLAALARPMPRPPRRAARVGELFHAWLERRFVATPALLEDPDEDVATDADLARLVAAFEAGPFADRTPHATEVPFSLFLAGQVVRGRIDAVFTDRGRPEVVDWKTGRGRANPLQLAVYRLAWAELNGLAVDDVDAAFFDVTRGVLVRPSGLPDRAGLERLVGRLTPTR